MYTMNNSRNNLSKFGWFTINGSHSNEIKNGMVNENLNHGKF